MRRIAFPLALLLVLAGCRGGGYRVVRHEGYLDHTTVAYTVRTQTLHVSYSDYMTRMLTQPGGADSALYIPGYAYFQGLIYTPGRFVGGGQVRLIGGVISGADSALSSGAMVTTNPEALMQRVQPTHTRYLIKNWREVP